MAINLLNGQMLNANLQRDGVNLAIVNSANSTPTFYADVGNNRVGINTNSPDAELTVNGNAVANNVNITNNLSLSGNVVALGNVTASNLKTSGPTGNITGANVVSANTFIGNTFEAANLSVSDTILAPVISVSGNTTTANLIVTNLANLANVVITTITVTGNISGSNLSLSGNVTAANVNTTGIVYGGSLSVTGTATLPTITGLTNGNVNITANGTGTVNLDNLTVKNTTINSISSGNVVQFGGTFGVAVPYGNTLERPGNTTFVGTTRWNTLLETLETWSGNTWVSGGSVPLGAVVDQQITPDGTSVAYTLNQSATNTNIIVSINGILQLPGVAYNAAGTTITFAQAPLTNDIVDIRFIAYTSTLSALTNSSGNAYVVVNDDSTINFATSGATAVDIDASGNLNANIINANSVHTGNILTDNYLYANGSPYTPGNAVSSEQINTTNFSFKQASGKLIFYFGNTEIASLDSAGNFTTTGNISAHGTP